MTESSALAKLGAVLYTAHEGGGVTGIAQLPALRQLESVKKLSFLHESAGTSAGALIALLVVLGADTAYMEHVLRTTDWKQWAGPRWRIITSTIRFLRSWGIFPSTAAREWIAARLEDFGHSRDITFYDLWLYTGRKLHVTTTNQDAGKPQLFNVDTSPSVKVLDAVLASMSIQLFYPPVVINGDRHGDGGATWNHPIDVFAGKPVEEILGIRVDSTAEISGRPARVRNCFDNAGRTLSIIRGIANKTHIDDKLWPRIVRVECNFQFTKFHFSDEEAAYLLDCGERATQAWLRK